MSTPAKQVASLRFVTFRAGEQSFAIAASAVVGTLDAGTIKPASEARDDGAIGTLTFEQEVLTVFDVARRLGIDGRRDDGKKQYLVMKTTSGRFVLQARDVSTALTLPPGNDVSLPAPLDRIVGDRYSAILKMPKVVKSSSDGPLSNRITTSRSRRDEPTDDLYLLLNHDGFLGSRTQVLPETPESVNSNPATAVADANPHVQATGQTAAKRRLMLFSPSPDTLGDRPYLFGISAAQVIEVCRPMPILPVPGATTHVVGVVNWRGTIVPVLRMAELVGLEGVTSKKARRLLIAVSPDGQHLLAVQALATLRTVDLPIANTPHALSNSTAARYLHGSYELEHETLVMPNLKSMLQLV